MNSTRKVAEQIVDDCAKRQIASPEWGTPTKWVTEYDEGKLLTAIDSALRQREQEARAEGWLQIESAPKDETEIILACFTFVSIVPINFLAASYWLPACVGSPLLGTDDHCVCCPIDPDYKGEWKGWEHVCAYPPTHWQPLVIPAIRRDDTPQEGEQ